MNVIPFQFNENGNVYVHFENGIEILKMWAIAC